MMEEDRATIWRSSVFEKMKERRGKGGGGRRGRVKSEEVCVPSHAGRISL